MILFQKIPLENEKIIFSNKGYWYENQFGYVKFFKNIKNGIPGITLLTEQNLYFYIWEVRSERYIQILNIPYEYFTLVELKKNGNSRLLVIQAKDKKPHSFSFDVGLVVAKKRTEEAFEFLNRKFEALKQPEIDFSESN